MSQISATPGSVHEYDEARSLSHLDYILPAILKAFAAGEARARRAFELGCGDGFVAETMKARGFEVVGVDPSRSGIASANRAYPSLALQVGSSEDDLAAAYGRFPYVYSIEVVAHVRDAHLFARRVYDLLENGGVAVVSAPFHGYWKNLALALANKWDFHLHTLESTKYLSFFSEATFSELWAGAGFRDIEIVRVGRIKPLAKAMVAVLRKR